MKVLAVIFDEIINNGIGWFAGLTTSNLLSKFFIAKKWYNLKGAFSKKIAIESNTLSAMEWILTALIGFLVLVLVNRIVIRPIWRSIKDKRKKSVATTAGTIEIPDTEYMI